VWRFTRRCSHKPPQGGQSTLAVIPTRSWAINDPRPTGYLDTEGQALAVDCGTIPEATAGTFRLIP
jgi:hypothetical protein